MEALSTLRPKAAAVQPGRLSSVPGPHVVSDGTESCMLSSNKEMKGIVFKKRKWSGTLVAPAEDPAVFCTYCGLTTVCSSSSGIRRPLLNSQGLGRLSVHIHNIHMGQTFRKTTKK